MHRIVLIAALLLGALAVADAATTFTYSLAKAGTTSAGVYSPQGVLVRTLWFNVPKPAGASTASWDNLDDDGQSVVPGDYEIRVLVHNMQYNWDGVVGNNSASMSGTTIHKGMYPLRDLTITGTNAFYTSGYNEGMYDFHRFDTATPQVRRDSWTWVRDTRGGPRFLKQYDCYGPVWSFATTDGTNVYFGCPAGWNNSNTWSVAPGYVIVNRVSDDGQSDAFTNGRELPFLGTPYVYPHGIQVGTQAGLSGLAVQPAGKLLAAAVAPDNKIYLLNKVSGDVLSSFAVPNPKRLVFDAQEQLWIAAGTNVYCYALTGGPAYTPTLVRTLPGFSNALAVAVSPTTDLVVVADGGASMQVKGFTIAGAPLWTYGRAGGQPQHGPAVTDDTLWFFVEAVHSLTGGQDTFLSFAPDGTFWVGDPMNARIFHLKANPKPRVIDRLTMQPMCYAIAVDQTNPRRVFRNFLEFNVDYRKPLGPDNGSWKLVNNWAGCRPAWSTVAPDESTGCLGGVTTLSNGRTYAQLTRRETDTNGVVLVSGAEIVELTSTGLRPTGQPARGAMGPDGTLFRAAPNNSNGSFETGGPHGWAVWTSGNPTNWQAIARQTPDTPTDGAYDLHLQAGGPAAGGQVAVSLGQTVASLERGAPHTFTMSLDVQNQTNGFDTVIIELLSANSKGGVTASVQPSPAVSFPADGRWHSYTTTLTLPASPSVDTAQLRMSFLKGAALAGHLYEANLDNVQLRLGSTTILIDRGTQYWYRAPLTGFDSSGNPQWGPEAVLATLPELPGASPSISASVLSSQGLIACYEPGYRSIRHLGGLWVGQTHWAWRAFPSTNTTQQTVKVYPAGYYDLGNGLATGGNIALAAGRHIIAGYHGEGWHGNQANQLMHFYDDGLFIGEFGVSGINSNGVKWAADYSKAGYAGNAFSPALAVDRREIYVYLNDEWGTPLQRYHLIGANDIRELSGTGPLDSTIKLTPLKAAPKRQRAHAP